ncbi:hypothetical protein [Kitasatospora sp. A2-31]|uniref:hypothetical protein n=1 Tax=Kitasatospora sp. A2-31 TaxID=2916414 RepID=UPI001EEEC6CC|nr:hypothetical protein [Kitasatospora sp. A2-31]MCG6499350.1 hypothetical protein [Kitasatospora sp. A2-31]
MTDPKRGSEALMEAWRKAGQPISDEFVSGLADITSELALERILIRGIPRPDVLQATFRADGNSHGAQIGSVVQQLVDLAHRTEVADHTSLTWQTRGLPPVIDSQVIEVSVGVANRAR